MTLHPWKTIGQALLLCSVYWLTSAVAVYVAGVPWPEWMLVAVLCGLWVGSQAQRLD